MHTKAIVPTHSLTAKMHSIKVDEIEEKKKNKSPVIRSIVCSSAPIHGIKLAGRARWNKETPHFSTVADANQFIFNIA